MSPFDLEPRLISSAVVKAVDADGNAIGIDDGGEIKTTRLSPFDTLNRGRGMPMMWTYKESLNPALLTKSLQRTLAFYAVFAGRYKERDDLDHQPVPPLPMEVSLTNEGVPVEVYRIEGCSSEEYAAGILVMGDSSGKVVNSKDFEGIPSSLESQLGATAVKHEENKEANSTEPPTNLAQTARDLVHTGNLRFFPLASIESLCAHVEPMIPQEDRKKSQWQEPGTSSVPLLAARITEFSEGGTVIGLAIAHGVADADSCFGFMRSWGQVYGEMSSGGGGGDDSDFTDFSKAATLKLNPSPDHDRVGGLGLTDSSKKQDSDSAEGGDPLACDHVLRSDIIPAKQSPGMPAFVKIMPKVMPANFAAVVPFRVKQLTNLKSAVLGVDEAGEMMKELGTHISTDDILTALCWRAQCLVRCEQLDLDPETCELKTTCMRAVNIRSRMNPPLSPYYCSCGVITVYTDCTVKELCAGHAQSGDSAEQKYSSLLKVAIKLRKTLIQHGTSESIQQTARELDALHADGRRPMMRFDENGMCFVVSSWRNFAGSSWRDARFSGSQGNDNANGSEVKKQTTSSSACCIGGHHTKVDSSTTGNGVLAPPTPAIGFFHRCLLFFVTVFCEREDGGVDIWVSGSGKAMVKFGREVTGSV